jgi:hypothetical protein
MPSVLEKIERGDAWVIDGRNRVIGIRKGGSSHPTLLSSEDSVRPDGLTSADLQAAHDRALAEGMSLNLAGQTYKITSPLTFKPNRVHIIGADATFDCSEMTGDYAVLLHATAADPSFDQKSRSISNITFAGPGMAVSGKAAIRLSGSVAGRSARPTFYNVNIHGFEVGIDLINYAYLTQFYSSAWRNCKIAIRQSSGIDAGENCYLVGCEISLCDLAFHLIDGSSEWFASGCSFDYIDQLLVAVGVPSRLHLTDCHIEPRGADDGSGLYVLDGSGTDPRAPVATKDSFIDIDGNGSFLKMSGGWFDINNSGGVGPYAYDHLVKVRNNNSFAMFRDVSMQNMANTSNKFWTGTGQCIVTGAQTQHTPAMPSRITDQTFGNVLRDGGLEDGAINDLWYVSKDTATITSRLTGTNITLARSTAQKRSGASSMLVTKVSSGSGQVSILVPVKQGDRLSVFGYSFLAAGAGGAIFADCRWANMLGLDSNGVPIISSASGVPFHASTTLSATTGSFQPFEIKTYDNGASGEPCAPAWVTHMRISFNLDNVSVSSTLLYLDDVHVSRW